jgi:hypothetical protein
MKSFGVLLSFALFISTLFAALSQEEFCEELDQMFILHEKDFAQKNDLKELPVSMDRPYYQLLQASYSEIKNSGVVRFQNLLEDMFFAEYPFGMKSKILKNFKVFQKKAGKKLDEQPDGNWNTLKEEYEFRNEIFKGFLAKLRQTKAEMNEKAKAAAKNNYLAQTSQANDLIDPNRQITSVGEQIKILNQAIVNNTILKLKMLKARLIPPRTNIKVDFQSKETSNELSENEAKEIEENSIKVTDIEDATKLSQNIPQNIENNKNQNYPSKVSAGNQIVNEPDTEKSSFMKGLNEISNAKNVHFETQRLKIASSQLKSSFSHDSKQESKGPKNIQKPKHQIQFSSSKNQNPNHVNSSKSLFQQIRARVTKLFRLKKKNPRFQCLFLNKI